MMLPVFGGISEINQHDVDIGGNPWACGKYRGLSFRSLMKQPININKASDASTQQG